MVRQVRHTGFVSAFVRHPNAANLLMVLLILAGGFALGKLNTQRNPTIEIPRITVSVSWPGANAEDLEANVLQALEPPLRLIDGLKETTSYAREGNATISLEFDPSADMQKAQSDVEQAVASVNTLPDDAEEPEVSRRNWYETIARLAISGPFTEEGLKQIAKRIRDDLLAAGIDRVTFEGVRDEEIWIEVDPQDLARLDLTVDELSKRIVDSSRDLPSGALQGDVERQIRALANTRKPEEFAAIEVRALPTGERLRLGDIAKVSAQFDKRQPVGLVGGERAIEITIERAAAADTLASARILDAYLEKLMPTLPPTLKLQKYDVRADMLKQRINLLVTNGLSGLALVLAILFLFLNFRVAFWVAAGIPVAMMATLAVMWAMGQTINMISLFALIMMLGIIVDDAIVVGEHTATLHAQGRDPLDAAENGVLRMLMPVTAATLTTMAAFMPLFLVRDVIGQFMQVLPLVVIAVLIASLVESFLVLPGHLRHGLGSKPYNPSRFRRAFDRGFNWFRDGPFNWMVIKAYRWRYSTLAAAIGLLILSLSLYSGGLVRFQFFPSPEAENIQADVVFVAGIRRAEAAAALKQIEDALYEVERDLTGKRGTLVSSIFTTLGKSGRAQGDNLATVDVQLTVSEARDVRTSQILKAWNKAVPNIAGVESIAISGRSGGPGGRDLDIRLQNAAPQVLKAAASDLAQLLTQYPGVSGVLDDLPYGKRELILQLTARGASLGFTVQSVGAQVRHAFEGNIAKRFARRDDEVTVRVMLADRDGGIDALRNLYLRNPAGQIVPLREVVSIKEQPSFSVIQRRDGKTTVAVTAEVDQDIVTNPDLVAALEAGPMQEFARKHAITYEFAGRERDRLNAFADLKLGVWIALGVIYIILAYVFASYSRPFAVMMIIPFGIVGAVVGHWLMGFPLTIMSMMALLGLSGILVNDSIILVSRLDERLDEGEDLEQAAIGAARDRLRAVLLTSLTTIGGLLPLLFEQSLQARYLLPMAVTLVFGLAVATLLVLFLVPAFVGIGGDLARLNPYRRPAVQHGSAPAE